MSQYFEPEELLALAEQEAGLNLLAAAEAEAGIAVGAPPPPPQMTTADMMRQAQGLGLTPPPVAPTAVGRELERWEEVGRQYAYALPKFAPFDLERVIPGYTEWQQQYTQERGMDESQWTQFVEELAGLPSELAMIHQAFAALEGVSPIAKEALRRLSRIRGAKTALVKAPGQAVVKQTTAQALARKYPAVARTLAAGTKQAAKSAIVGQAATQLRIAGRGIPAMDQLKLHADAAVWWGGLGFLFGVAGAALPALRQKRFVNLDKALRKEYEAYTRGEGNWKRTLALLTKYRNAAQKVGKRIPPQYDEGLARMRKMSRSAEGRAALDFNAKMGAPQPPAEPSMALAPRPPTAEPPRPAPPPVAPAAAAAVAKPPAVAEPAGKQAWKMTTEEFGDQPISIIGIRSGYPAGAKVRDYEMIGDDVPWYSQHGISVENAIRRGDPVPPEVLAEYPHLARPAAVTEPPALAKPWQMTQAMLPKGAEIKTVKLDKVTNRFLIEPGRTASFDSTIVIYDKATNTLYLGGDFANVHGHMREAIRIVEGRTPPPATTEVAFRDSRTGVLLAPDTKTPVNLAEAPAPVAKPPVEPPVATDVARKEASLANIPLEEVKGTGAKGRVTAADVRAEMEKRAISREDLAVRAKEAEVAETEAARAALEAEKPLEVPKVPAAEIPEDIQVATAALTPVQALRQLLVLGKKAHPRTRRQGTALRMARKAMKQARSDIEKSPAYRQAKLDMPETAETPLLDWLGKKQVGYGPFQDVYGEFKDLLSGQPVSVRRYFKKATKAGVIDGVKVFAADELAADAVSAGFLPEGATEVDLATAIVGEAKAGRPGKDFEAVLDYMDRAVAEQMEAYAGMPEAEGAEIPSAGEGYRAVKAAAADAEVALKESLGRDMARVRGVGVAKERARVEKQLQELERLRTMATEQQLAVLDTTIKQLNDELAQAQEALAERKQGVPRLRQRIAGLVKVKNIPKTRFADLRQRFLGKGVGLSQATNAEDLAKLLRAVEAAPSGPNATPAALARAKQRGLTEKLHEVVPETGEETVEDVLRGGWIRGTGENGAITVPDIDRLIKTLDTRAKRKAALEAEVGELTAFMDTVQPPTGEDPIRGIGESRSAPEVARDVKLWAVRPVRLIRRLDGEIRFGPHNRLLWRRTSDSLYKPIRAKTMMEKRAKAKLKSLGLRMRQLNKRREVPGVRRLTPRVMLGVYLSTLDEGKLAALQASEVFTDQQIDAIVKALKPNEKAFGDWMVKVYRGYGPKVEQILRDLYMKDLQYVKNYSPIRYVQGEAQPFADELVQEMVDRGIYRRRRYIERRFTMPRTGPAGRPLELDAVANFFANISRFENFIHTAIPVYEARTIIEHPEWAARVRKNHGDATYNHLRKWLDDAFGLGVQKRIDGAEKTARAIRTNTAASMIAANPLSVARAPISFLSSIAYEPHPWNLPMHLFALAELAAHPLQTRAFVLEKWPHLADRFTQMQREFREIEERFAGRPQLFVDIVKVGVMGYRAADFVTVTSSTLAHYVKALRLGAGESEAIIKGTQVIEETQPIARKIDLAPLWRSSEIWNWFTTFQNQVNQIFNQLFEDNPGFFRSAKTQAILAGKKGPGMKGWTIASLQVFWTTLFAGFLTALLLSIIRHGRVPTKKEVKTDMTGYTLGTVPGIGWLTQEVLWGYGLTEPAALEGFRDIGRGLTAGTLPKAIEATTMGITRVFFGLPVTGPVRTIRGIAALAAMETDELRRLLYSEWQLKPGDMSVEAYRLLKARRIPPEQWNKIGRNDKDNIGVVQVREALKWRVIRPKEQKQ